jgi:hypothetical protein
MCPGLGWKQRADVEILHSQLARATQHYGESCPTMPDNPVLTDIGKGDPPSLLCAKEYVQDVNGETLPICDRARI